jgi:enoyl-CoA hydratase
LASTNRDDGEDVSLVTLDIHGGEDDSGSVAVVRLNDPEHRNMLSSEMVKELLRTLDSVENRSDVRAVILSGVGGAFCSGADLSKLLEEHERESDDRREAGLRSIYAGFLRVLECPLPTIGAVNGPAVGAGLNLALACDVRIAGASATFDTRFLKLGLHPGGGHTKLLQDAVGPAAASAMILFGQVLNSRDAERLGLVFGVFEDDALMGEALRIASFTSQVPRDLLMKTKDSMHYVRGVNDHSDAVDLEVAAQVWSIRQSFFRDRVAAASPQISKRLQE